MSNFAKDNEGTVHLIGSMNAEFTLCGNAFEGDCEEIFSKEPEPKAWEVCKPQKITCPQCLRQIKACKNVSNQFIL